MVKINSDLSYERAKHSSNFVDVDKKGSFENTYISDEHSDFLNLVENFLR